MLFSINCKVMPWRVEGARRDQSPQQNDAVGWGGEVELRGVTEVRGYRTLGTKRHLLEKSGPEAISLSPESAEK